MAGHEFNSNGNAGKRGYRKPIGIQFVKSTETFGGPRVTSKSPASEASEGTNDGAGASNSYSIFPLSGCQVNPAFGEASANATVGKTTSSIHRQTSGKSGETYSSIGPNSSGPAQGDRMPGQANLKKGKVKTRPTRAGQANAFQRVMETSQVCSVQEFLATWKQEADEDIARFRKLAYEVVALKSQQQNAKDKLHSASNRVPVRIEFKTEIEFGAKNEKYVLWNICIGGVHIASGQGKTKKISKTNAFEIALQKILMPHLRIIYVSPTDKELQASEEPFTAQPLQSLKVSLNSNQSALPKDAGKEVASQHKELNVEAAFLKQRYNEYKPLEEFVIVEPKVLTQYCTAAHILQRSADFNHMLLEYKHVFKGGAARCILRIENEILADVSGISKEAAESTASAQALLKLKHFCWIIKTKQAMNSNTKLSIEKLPNELNDTWDDVSHHNIDNKLLRKMGWSRGGLGKDGDGIAEASSLEGVLNREGLGLRASKEVSDESRWLNLGSKSKGKKQTGKLCIQEKISVKQLFDHLMSVGGETAQYQLVPPGQDLINDNIANKLLHKIAWSRGGNGESESANAEPGSLNSVLNRKDLGLSATKGVTDEKDGSGSAELVSLKSVVNKEDLGLSAPYVVDVEFRRIVREVIKNYLASNDLEDLVFSCDFSLEERQIIHKMCKRLNLRSRSKGQGQMRYLCVRRRLKDKRKMAVYQQQLCDDLVSVAGKRAGDRLVPIGQNLTDFVSNTSCIDESAGHKSSQLREASVKTELLSPGSNSDCAEMAAPFIQESKDFLPVEASSPNPNGMTATAASASGCSSNVYFGFEEKLPVILKPNSDMQPSKFSLNCNQSVLAKDAKKEVLSRHKESNMAAAGLKQRDNEYKALDEFVIMEPKGNQKAAVTLQRSADSNHMLLEYEYLCKRQAARCILRIENEILADVSGISKPAVKNAASAQALLKLKNICWIIKIKTKQEVDSSIKISKGEMLNELNGTSNGISHDNIGNKLLRKMGWSGGGLGKDGSGIAEPVFLNSVLNREGLGLSATKGVNDGFRRKAKEIIENYITSNNHEDLIFYGDFSRDERQIIHDVCWRMNLRSHNKGKGQNGKLCIERKRSLKQLFNHLRSVGGETARYQLIPPGQDLIDNISGNKLLSRIACPMGGDGSGTAEPASLKSVVNREDLGLSATKGMAFEFRRKIKEVIENYLATNDLEDLVFSSDFSLEERMIIHEVSEELNLRSRSKGQGQMRYLCVRRKLKEKRKLAVYKQQHGCLMSVGSETAERQLVAPGRDLIDSTLNTSCINKNVGHPSSQLGEASVTPQVPSPGSRSNSAGANETAAPFTQQESQQFVPPNGSSPEPNNMTPAAASAIALHSIVYSGFERKASANSNPSSYMQQQPKGMDTEQPSAVTFKSEYFEVEEKQKMNFGVNVESLRDEFESNTEWGLRRQFLKSNLDEVPIDRLICLSRCFVNMAVYECSYPNQVMIEVRERSKGLMQKIERERKMK